jgi:pimeloyl-ACP methyl ester carboxylesterase
MQYVTEKLLVRFGDKLGTMLVRIWKAAASQGTVFCIHGFEGNGSDFDYLASFLAKRGFTMVCPDMIGRGASTYFGDPKMYNMQSYLSCIGALSRFAGDKNHFIGTSWGGAVLLYFLCLTRIEAKTVVLNDVGMRPNRTVREAVDFIAQDAHQTFDTAEQAEAYVRKTRDYLGTFSEDLWLGYLKNKIRFSEGKYRLAYDPAVVGLHPEILNTRYDLFPLLEKLDARLLLLYGVNSKCYEPDMVADLMRRRSNISCIPELKSGHPPSLMTYEQALMVAGFFSS